MKWRQLHLLCRRLNTGINRSLCVGYSKRTSVLRNYCSAVSENNTHHLNTTRAETLSAPMAALEEIANVTKISDRVIRVLGQNPGKFTLQGTNTYLIGTSNPYILIDTAEGREEFIPVLRNALLTEAKPSNPILPDVSDIIISHWHHDHVGGLPTVLALLKQLWTSRNPSTPYSPPRLHKHPLPPRVVSEEEAKWHILPKILAALPEDLYTAAPSGEVLHVLADSQVLEPPGTTLRVIHTPGHTRDSISLYIPQDRALYTADTVLGQGTAVFEDLGLYLKSLNKMLKLGGLEGDKESDYDILYPSHGPVVAKGQETIANYIKHRLDREVQVLQLLAVLPEQTQGLSDSQGQWTTWDIVKKLYASYPESLWLPAARGIELHLKKLEEEGRIRKLGGEGKDVAWRLVSRTPTPSL
ncbi:Metallo-hydrolase/oxidoreductase [Coprinopsis marcescibilis]|uniref:Metallo-hydrolase/oxidoreductase n=1 Tax=Coprinopsis marcescibilis TaxID=230819 RepID=A0A5C3KZN0_COPMA|nr:Metallo-hydrolase/oxidoreductase [Coprinopsis marcescibilis]